MSVSPIKLLTAAPLIAGIVIAGSLAAFAQDTKPPANRDASFVAEPAISAPTGFSGLAAPTAIESAPAAPPPLALPATAPIAAVTPTAPTPDAKPPILGAPVDIAPLPDVSAESIGTNSATSLGTAMWKGTSRMMAENLIIMARPTTSFILNDLARKLLKSAAIPPEGRPQAEQSLAALRVGKLVQFSDAPDAWSLATHTDAKLMDDATIKSAADAALAYEGTEGSDTVCNALHATAEAHSGADWQEENVICELKAKDMKAAQVTLDVLRTQPKHDDIFLTIADKYLVDQLKSLPSQLTPLSHTRLALLQQVHLPLSGDLYAHPDSAFMPALLRLTTKQDVAQLGLGERAASRGIIDSAALAALYRGVSFAPDALATPLAASESGSRLRALLVQAATAEKNTSNRITYATKFLQSAPPELAGGAGPLLAEMVGTIEPDATLKDNAVTLAQIYMLGNRGELALGWLKIARQNQAAQADLQNLWPQFTLAGFESDSALADDLDHWLDALLKAPDPQADLHVARDNATASLLLCDAAGFAVPDSAWQKVLTLPRADKKIALSPLLLSRLHAASAAGHKAETVLLSIAAAGEGEIPLLTAVSITSALHSVGLKNEAGSFARQILASQTKTN
jgi:hypothetical protein